MPQYLPWLVTALALVVLLLLLVWQQLAATRRREPMGPKPLPTSWDLLPRPVFSADERRLYRQLREALPHHVVLAKLPLVRFCQPTDPAQVRYWYEVLGACHVTFAICSINGRVLAAVDLNYERSGSASRATRIKQSVLGACRIRYLRCAPDHLPSVPELQLLVPQASQAARGPQPARPVPTGARPPDLRGGPIGLNGHHRPEQANGIRGLTVINGSDGLDDIDLHRADPTATATPRPVGRGAASGATADGSAHRDGPRGPAIVHRRVEHAPLWEETMGFKDSFFQTHRPFATSDLGGLDDATAPRPNGLAHADHPAVAAAAPDARVAPASALRH